LWCGQAPMRGLALGGFMGLHQQLKRLTGFNGLKGQVQTGDFAVNA
jgi:hypothetical protein